MKSPNRDMLVLVKDDQTGSNALEMEMDRINKILISVETREALSIAHEVIDINRCKKIKVAHEVNTVLQDRFLKPFVFIINKN
jgi:hypothetical protein